MNNYHQMNLFSRIYNPENIYHAWQKSQYIYENESDFIVCIMGLKPSPLGETFRSTC